MSKNNKNINNYSNENHINNSNNKDQYQNQNDQDISNKDNLVNEREQLMSEKINKPDELKNFDAISHFKENITNFCKNCPEPVKDKSYYCFNCKHSTCEECTIYNHKNHLLVQRDNCLNFDNTFFNEISTVIEQEINVDDKKNQIKNEISKSINDLKEELDEIEKQKLLEIDNFFEEIRNNYLALKENYLKTKESIENYYNTNKKFYNINIQRTNENNDDNSYDNYNNKLEGNSKKSSFIDKNNYCFNNYLNDNEIGPNKDSENTVFIMNFELMNLCDNKNLQILDITNEIKKKIQNISILIEQKTNLLKEEIKKNCLDFENNSSIAKFDDFYWDIKIRCEKYTEHISQFKNIIYELYKKNGNFDKVKDLLALFDAKNHKGKDCLFNQPFFIKMNDLSSLSPDNANSLSKKLLGPSSKSRKSSKKKFINRQNSNNNSTIKTKESRLHNDRTKNSLNKGIDKYGNKSSNNNSSNDIEFKRSNSNLNLKKNSFPIMNLDKDNIILNQRIIERFFAYSILDFYSKHFKIISLEDNALDDPYYYLNIYKKKYNNDLERMRDKEVKDNGGKKSHRSRSVKSGNKKGHYNNNGINNSNLRRKNMNNNTNSTFVRSVNLLSNYSERYTELKEKAKPIIGTNYVQFFEPMTNRITKFPIPLNKETHGYTTFPDGCRHILIDQFLYVTGGSDNCGYPINVALMINVENGEITRIGNLNDNHSYHSLEFLENFDCIILIGGENSTSCEIMDIDSRKWTKLPSLNFPRANCNIYYNSITSDLFVLFGIEGDINKPKYTDTIEVLELNDIISGWMKVEYYKTVGFDMKNNYCITIPFTRDKLLVYGGSTGRSIEKRIFALFDMVKNEIIKVDEKTMDLIKIEENKIKSFDKVIEKFFK